MSETDSTQAELRKEIDVIVGNPLNRIRDTDAIVELVTTYTDKQIEAVLDRLLEHSEDFTTFGDASRSVAVEYILAERKQLKEGRTMTAKPQYDGRLYSQAEVDRMMVEARLNEVQNSYEYWINGRKFISSYFRDRIAELSKTIKEHKEK